MRQGVSRFPIRTASMAAAAMLALPLMGGIARAGDQISIYFVGCAPPTGFHGYIARAAEEAGRNLGVKVTCVYPDELTIPNQIQKIEEAIAAKPSGIVLCNFVEDSAYTEVAAAVKAAGIALGSDAAPPAGNPLRDPNDMFLFRTGADETAAGRLTAHRLITMGIKGRVVVSDQDPGVATCRERANSEIARSSRQASRPSSSKQRWIRARNPR